MLGVGEQTGLELFEGDRHPISFARCADRARANRRYELLPSKQRRGLLCGLARQSAASPCELSPPEES